MRQKQAWTPKQEAKFKRLLRTSDSKTAAFIAIAEQTGRSVKAVSNHYYYNQRHAGEPSSLQESPATGRGIKWSKEDNEVLLRYLDARGVSNMRAVFLAVAEQLGRSEGAVAAHWYGHLSKQPEVRKYARLSPHDILWNRKNGKGKTCAPSVWFRIMSFLKGLGL